MKTKIFQYLVLSVYLLCFYSCDKTIEADLVITNVNIIDVKTGAINSNMDVIIDGETITSINEHKKSTTYQTENVIDGTDKFLIPGLWDMHGHWIDSYNDFFPMLLANGVVGIRDMWGNLSALKKVRQLIAEGTIAGPDVFTAGLMVDGKEPYWPGASVSADTPEEGRKIVRQQKEDGVDFIKVYSRLERDVYFAIADECKKQNIPMAGHIPAKIALNEAINSNHLSFEHFYQIKGFLHPQYDNYLKMLHGKDHSLSLSDKAKKYIEEIGFEVFDTVELDSLDMSRVPKLVELLANSNSWVTPTLVTTKGYFRTYDPNFNPETLNRFMPDNAVEDYYVKDTLKTKLDSTRFDWRLKDNKITIELIKPMIDGGVKFLAGTDYVIKFCYPGFSLHDELQIFVEEAGITPLQALQTATINPANFLNIEHDFGTVETGKIASLLLLDSNPLEDINNTREIDCLILRGNYHSKETLSENLNILSQRQAKPKIRHVLKPIIIEERIEKAIEMYHNLKEEKSDIYNFDKHQLNFLGYDLLELKQINDAIIIFELNMEIFPEFINGYDSLADAYLANNEKDKAIASLKKAVALGGSDVKLKGLEKKGG